MMKRKTLVRVGVPLVGVLLLSFSACRLPGSRDEADPASCDWSVDRLAAQVVVVPVDQSNVAAAVPAVAAGAGGVILFGKNTPPSFQADIAALVGQAPDGRAPFVMSDEEGGSVQRMANAVGKLNSARWMADHWSADRIKQEAHQLGGRMKGLGVTMDLAPVLDLDNQDTTPGKGNAVGDRSFGGDPVRTSQDGVAFAKGLQEAGVVPVVKHFPGLGGASGGNTDYSLAQTLPWDQLKQTALQPFRAAVEAGIPAIMTANAVVPGLTDKPASVSQEVIKVLREDLHFDGLIVTDTLTAGALSVSGYTPEAAAVAALKAGANLLLYGGNVPTSIENFNSMVAAIVAAVNKGELPRDTLVAAVNAVLKAHQLPNCGA